MMTVHGLHRVIIDSHVTPLFQSLASSNSSSSESSAEDNSLSDSNTEDTSTSHIAMTSTIHGSVQFIS